MKEAVKFSAPEGTKNALKNIAEGDETMTDTINRLLLPHLKDKGIKNEKISPPGNILLTRINDEECKILAYYLNEIQPQISISRLLNNLLRSELKMKRILMPLEVDTLQKSVYQLRSIGVNLNQILANINTDFGEGVRRVTPNYLEKIIDYVGEVASEFESYKIKNGKK